MATIKVASKAKLLGVFIGSNVTWGPVPLTSILRRNIARHIAGLANHGGGYPVFGFRDDRAPNPSPPFQLESFSRDNISSIIKRYLAPAFAPGREIIAP